MAIDATPVTSSTEPACKNCKALPTADQPLVKAGLHSYCVECAPPAHDRRPFASLSGQDGNVFAVIGRAHTALKSVGMRKKGDAMQSRIIGINYGVSEAHSYEEALRLILEYVEDGDPRYNESPDDDDD